MAGVVMRTEVRLPPKSLTGEENGSLSTEGSGSPGCCGTGGKVEDGPAAGGAPRSGLDDGEKFCDTSL